MKSTEIFQLLWPEQRAVDGKKISVWADDAVANGEIRADEVDLSDPVDCARALHEAGLITLASSLEILEP